MALSLGVGVLARCEPDARGSLQRQLEIINRLLAQRGLPQYDEPEADVVPAGERPSFAGIPYSSLHCLRRFVARCKEDGRPPPPLAPGERPERDRAIAEASEQFDVHLLVHSDSEGFYIPIDFEQVIFDRERLGLAGGMLGSSVRLGRELATVAPALQIALTGAELAAHEQHRIEREVATEVDPFWRERMCWLALFQAARASVKYKVLVAFQ